MVHVQYSSPASISSRRETRANLDLTSTDIDEIPAFVSTRRPVRRIPPSNSRAASVAPDLSETLVPVPEVPGEQASNSDVGEPCSSASAFSRETRAAPSASVARESSRESGGHVRREGSLSYDQLFAPDDVRRGSSLNERAKQTKDSVVESHLPSSSLLHASKTSSTASAAPTGVSDRVVASAAYGTAPSGSTSAPPSVSRLTPPLLCFRHLRHCLKSLF